MVLVGRGLFHKNGGQRWAGDVGPTLPCPLAPLVGTQRATVLVDWAVEEGRSRGFMERFNK
jgi:hypothetical protein